MKRYKLITVDGKQVLEHRVIWERAHGPVPKGYEIHHINGDGRDNRLENLALLTTSEHRSLHANARANFRDVVDASNEAVIASREQHKRWYAANRDKIRAKSKQYRLENADKIRAHDRERQALHREDRAARGAMYYAEHRSEKQANQRRYNATHKEQRKQYRIAHAAQILEYAEATKAIKSTSTVLRKAIRRGDPPSRIDALELKLLDEKSKFYRNGCNVTEKALAVDALSVFEHAGAASRR